MLAIITKHPLRLVVHLRPSIQQLHISSSVTSATAAAKMQQTSPSEQQQEQPQLKPEVSPEAQAQQEEGGVPPAKPTGTLQDVDPNELIKKRNQILWQQAQRGEQPGLMLMQDALSGEKKAQTWGNEPTMLEPEHQN